MSDDSWLDLDTPVAKAVEERADSRISSVGKLTKERSRGTAMHKSPLGKKRVWSSDGEYVYFRRKMSNPATLERHNRFIATGNYTHVQTQDDVEIYKLEEGSPFKRCEQNLAEISEPTLRRAARLALLHEDFGLFIDIVTEKSSRLKSRLHADHATAVFQEWMTYMFQLNEMQGGPSQASIDRGVQKVRKARGELSNRMIMIPTSSRIQ
jgi:hypothetical protein